jgi:photosystem II stability/assembly factor-like uncharacterized protein
MTSVLGFAACALAAGALAGCSALRSSGESGRRAPAVSARVSPDRGEDGPEATFAAEARRWRLMTWRDEAGGVPKQALAKASRERARNLAYWAAHGTADAKALLPNGWTFRGPANVGGRTRALLVDPLDPSKLLAGSVGGGLWKSADAGAHWSRVDDFLPNLAICSLARDPQDHRVIYAGTGEGFFNADAIDGSGIFKSVDGGDTWSQLPGTTTWDSVNRLAISPTDSHLILAATRYGGIERSTDGGATWNLPTFTQGSYDVAFSPHDGMKAVAEILDYDFVADDWFHRAVYSTDGGASWSLAAPPFDLLYGFSSRLELAYAPANGDIVYLNSGADGLIYRSTDGGHTYSPQTSSGATGASWYNNTLWVDPTNSQVLIAGGTQLFRSTDGGATLTQITDGYLLTAEPHPDQHCVVADPGYDGAANRVVYACNDGGVFRADDIYTASKTAGWSSLNQGYATSQYYSGAGDGPAGLFLGGTQDNGTLRLAAPASDALLSLGGDGGFVAVDPADPRYAYGEYINLSLVFRSVDGGQTIDTFLDTSLPESGQGNFVAPFILDPNHSGRMLAGAYSLWRSDDARTGSPPSWQAIRGARSTQVSAIAVAPGNSDIVWVGYNDGAVYRTANATAAHPVWQTVDDNGAADPLPNRMPLRILIDRRNSNWVYIAFGGFSSGNLQQTLDGGATWSALTGAGSAVLPAAPVHAIAQHPTQPDWLYAGTEVGIFSSLDGGQSWATTNQGPANVVVDDLGFLNNSHTLLAATHGRGVWTADVSGSPDTALAFFTLPPCRLLDTRTPAGPLGGPVLAAASARVIATGGHCGIPAAARALAVNLTVVSPRSPGFLTLYPGDLSRPPTSTINFRPGQVRANNAVVPLAADGFGSLALFNGSAGTADAIVDVSGYFQ